MWLGDPPTIQNPAGFFPPGGASGVSVSRDGALCVLRRRFSALLLVGKIISRRAYPALRPASCHAPPGHAGLFKLMRQSPRTRFSHVNSIVGTLGRPEGAPGLKGARRYTQDGYCWSGGVIFLNLPNGWKHMVAPIGLFVKSQIAAP